MLLLNEAGPLNVQLQPNELTQREGTAHSSEQETGMLSMGWRRVHRKCLLKAIK